MRLLLKLSDSPPAWYTQAMSILVGLLLLVLTSPADAQQRYRVEIPSPDSEMSDASLMKRFSTPAEAYLIKNGNSRRVQLGDYLRVQEAESLLGLVEEEYPSARVVKMEEVPDATVIPQHLFFSMKDIGYDKNLIAYGARPYVKIDFPWEPVLKLQDATLFLSLRVSPHLRLPSSLTVKVGENIVRTIAVGEGEEVIRLTIPLSHNDEYSEQLKQGNSLPVIIEGNLRIHADYCENARSVDTWLIVDNQSRLEIRKKGNTPGINSFLSGTYKELIIATLHDRPAYAQAALQVAAAVKAASPHVKVKHASRPMVSLTGRTIVIDEFKHDIRRQGATLYMNPAGAAAFGNAAHVLLASNRAEIRVNEPFDDEQHRQISFSALNWTTSSVNGVGELVLRLPFSLQQIGGFPKNLAATLDFSTTPVPEEDVGLIKVRLNGTLAGSLNLGHAGKTKRRSATISLPVDELNQRNQLEVVFVYYMEEGECRGAFPHLEATLFDTSFLMIGPSDKDIPLKLNRILGQMGGTGALVAPELNATTFAPLAEWAALYGEINQAVPRFRLYTSLSENHQYDYLVLSLGDAAMPEDLSPMVDTTQDIVVKNPLTGETPFQASVGSSVWVVQTFRHDAKPALLFSSFPPVSDEGPELSVQQFEQFGGNVAAGNDGIWRSMNIGRQLKVIVPTDPGIHYYWSRYKALILLFTAGLLLLFFYYVYRNLTSSK